jgi:hypothetical protein
VRAVAAMAAATAAVVSVMVVAAERRRGRWRQCWRRWCAGDAGGDCGGGEDGGERTAVAMAVLALLHALKDSGPPPGDAIDPAWPCAEHTAMRCHTTRKRSMISNSSIHYGAQQNHCKMTISRFAVVSRGPACCKQKHS